MLRQVVEHHHNTQVLILAVVDFLAIHETVDNSRCNDRTSGDSKVERPGPFVEEVATTTCFSN